MTLAPKIMLQELKIMLKKIKDFSMFCKPLWLGLLLGGFSLLITACQDDTTTDATEESYGFSKVNAYVRYIAQKRELQAEVSFRSDSTEKIEGEVLLNNESMTFKDLPVVGFQYRIIKEQVNFVNDYSFSYKEKDGSEQVLDISMGKFQSIRIASQGISREKGGVITWEGTSLDKNDGLVMVFTDTEGTTFEVNHTGVTKGNKFELLPVHTERLAKGEASVLITRKRTIVDKQSEPVKFLRIEYYLPPITFEVTD